MLCAFMSMPASAQMVLLLLKARYISRPVVGAEIDACHGVMEHLQVSLRSRLMNAMACHTCRSSSTNAITACLSG